MRKLNPESNALNLDRGDDPPNQEDLYRLILLAASSALKERSAYVALGADKNAKILESAYLMSALLASNDAPLNQEDLNKLLFLAASSGTVRDISTCLTLGAEVNAATPEVETGLGLSFWTPLHFAICKNSNKAVKFLLEAGADTNKEGLTVGDPPAFEESRGPLPGGIIPSNFGITPVHLAVMLANYEVFTALLKHGADTNQGFPGDISLPLHLAVGNFSHDDHRIVRALIENGADVLVRDDSYPGNEAEGLTALEYFIATFSDGPEDILGEENYKTLQILQTATDLAKATIEKEWRPKNHSKFPPYIQQQIKTMLVLALARPEGHNKPEKGTYQSLHPKACLDLLPLEVLQYVFTYVAAKPLNLRAPLLNLDLQQVQTRTQETNEKTNHLASTIGF